MEAIVLGGFKLQFAAHFYGSWETQPQLLPLPITSPQWPEPKRELTNLSRLSRLARHLAIEIGGSSDAGAEGRAAIWRTLSIWVGSDDRGGMYEEILKHGRSFSSRRPHASMEWGRSTSSFDNAVAALASRCDGGSNDVCYVEGLAAAPGTMWVPIHHAWLVGANGVVIDNSWRDGALASYFGIPFSTEFVLERYRKLCGRWSTILEKPSDKDVTSLDCNASFRDA